jgi:hypothetical protein
VRKDGSYLYPAMPYDSYTKITDADVAALWAYFRTVPAVHNVVPHNTLPFPQTRVVPAGKGQIGQLEPRRLSRRGSRPLCGLSYPTQRRPRA